LCHNIFYRFYFYSVSQIDVDFKDEFWGLISDLFIFGRSHHSVPAYLPHFLFEVLTVKNIIGNGGGGGVVI
jgi:hypothetical protein